MHRLGQELPDDGVPVAPPEVEEKEWEAAGGGWPARRGPPGPRLPCALALNSVVTAEAPGGLPFRGPALGAARWRVESKPPTAAAFPLLLLHSSAVLDLRQRLDVVARSNGRIACGRGYAVRNRQPLNVPLVKHAELLKPHGPLPTALVTMQQMEEEAASLIGFEARPAILAHSAGSMSHGSCLRSLQHVHWHWLSRQP